MSNFSRRLIAAAVALALSTATSAQTARPGVSDSSSRRLGADQNLVMPTFDLDAIGVAQMLAPEMAIPAGYQERAINQVTGPYFVQGPTVGYPYADQQFDGLYGVYSSRCGSGDNGCDWGWFDVVYLSAKLACGGNRDNRRIASGTEIPVGPLTRYRTTGDIICAPEGTRVVTVLERTSAVTSVSTVSIDQTQLADKLRQLQQAGLKVDALGAGSGNQVCQDFGYPKGMSPNGETRRRFFTCGDNKVAEPGNGAWTAVAACSVPGYITAVACLK